ncbi:MAG TPA: protein-glutamate O-methyltransferase CheR [Gemmatimonadales bacterium]
MSDDDGAAGLASLVAQIARARGFGCGAYKESCLRRRLAVRMRACGVSTYAEYARVLEGNAAEYEHLLDTLTINVTKFYRNRETWDALADRYVPDLWRARGGRLRAWSAGCASGEEPYTIAILFLEVARRLGSDGPLRARVDATDFDRHSLERARRGVYAAAALEELPDELLRRHFSGEGECAVNPAVRELVRFRQHDLLRDPPPDPPYDLIVCRNVVIYFDRPNQDRLFSAFADALTPGGVLVLGKVETLFGAARTSLRLDDTRERIFRRS